MEINPNHSSKANEDILLVEKAIKGDQKAFATLMMRYKDAIYFTMLKMVNNKEDANDLTVEAFSRAFENIERYKPTFAFSTWLFKIATNNCVDFIRKKRLKVFSIDQKIQTGDDEEISFDFKSENLDPEQSMIRKQKIEQMRGVVDMLPEKYKVLVVLRYFEEKSYDEIAIEMNLPIGTVKATLFRARDLLLNIVNSKGI